MYLSEHKFTVFLGFFLLKSSSLHLSIKNTSYFKLLNKLNSVDSDGIKQVFEV